MEHRAGVAEPPALAKFCATCGVTLRARQDSDEVVGIVALVAAHRDAATAGQARGDHRERGTPLGTSIGRFDLKVDQNGVAILHQAWAE